MDLQLNIDSDNAAMETTQDVAAALRRVAAHLEQLPSGSVFGGPIADYNGNTVGHYNGGPSDPETPDPLQGRDPDELHEMGR